MGGFGSSRWGGRRTRVCVESCFSIVPPRGELFPGTCEVAWERAGVRVWCSLVRDGAAAGFSLILRHDYHSGGVQTVRLVETHPNYGGVRWWFLCPGCGSRAGRLHLPGRGHGAREFKCRRCHGMTYESAQDSRSSESALWLALGRRWGCSTRAARDTFRRHAGAYLYEPKVLSFHP